MAFTSLAAGVSGLQAFSEGVGVIADNITNVNTIGYKESRSRFSTLVTETAAISSYSPGGVRSTTETLVSKQGLLQPSASSTDISIDGAGFFAVREDATNAGEVLYTRAGSFTQDEDGYLKNTAGLYLMGWELEEDGSQPVNSGQESALEPINFTAQSGASEATSFIDLRANFSAGATINSTYTLGEVADGTYSTAGDDFEEDIVIVDQQGQSHVLKISAVMTGVNTWTVEAYAEDSNLLDATAHPDGMVASGTLVFDGDGLIDLTASSFNQGNGGTALDLLTDSATLQFNNTASGSSGSSDIAINFGFGDGSPSNGITQTGSSTSLLSKNKDGADFGNVVGVTIGGNGDVTTLFDSGLSLTRYRLPVATFNNADGLIRRQGNSFGRSDISGESTYKSAGEDGAGKVASNTLELSTVDLAAEFAELIKTQRAFSASTRIISTSDEILEELTRL